MLLRFWETSEFLNSVGNPWVPGTRSIISSSLWMRECALGKPDVWNSLPHSDFQDNLVWANLGLLPKRTKAYAEALQNASNIKTATTLLRSETLSVNKLKPYPLPFLCGCTHVIYYSRNEVLQAKPVWAWLNSRVLWETWIFFGQPGGGTLFASFSPLAHWAIRWHGAGMNAFGFRLPEGCGDMGSVFHFQKLWWNVHSTNSLFKWFVSVEFSAI